ncbi:ABC transporter ATP-binding protein [Bordetella holmesii]|uniref:ABC transporter, ATP-binding protein n=2 Tax=Bordetella holmesii TaxID=35814 RepID=A0A158M0B3_9BORD|nr:ABC transporter ATP-binding protein [Bordetella holmesii]AHV93937.1 ABC transporter family protein [Bordetella holmesii ATCC 51541]AIT25215.1 ABC transporter family protein [Bordetella holmesii 44057]EWM45782.1 ABC transporter family protein [Bordetella holmesii 70147]EWM48647.1 ABC transporter family protein [Bordetella holmesii 41130]EWM49910.1 ABC transporter family protein [Bordetella holmesii 35009]
MLCIQGLSARYGATTVLRDISAAELKPGSLNALLGPNGSGKSTLLRALAGLLAAQGRLTLDGQSLAAMPPARRRQCLAYMPQALPRAVRLSVFEAVLIACGQRRPADAPQRVAALLDRLGIASLADRSLDALSGGQLQLVALAQALLRRPRVLLLDEPLSALDLNFQFHVMDLLKRETRAHGLITLVVLHDLNIALRHADHALMLCAGEVIAEGRCEEVIRPEVLERAYGVRTTVQGQAKPYLYIEGLARVPL